MNQLQKGFTLIELMIVVAIIGILAAVAIPAYNDYITRAQVAEGPELLAGFKTSFAEHCGSTGNWPTALASVGGNATGKYGAITLTGGAAGSCANGNAVELTYTLSTGRQSGNTVTLTSSDGGATWSCTGGTVPANFRPAGCK